MRRIILGAIALLFAAGFAFVPSPAHAALFDCKEAPVPISPQAGGTGLWTHPPAEPATGDPFTDPSIPIADVYGYAWTFAVYDMGCGPGGEIERQLREQVTNAPAIRILDASASWLAILGAIETFARADTIAWFGQIPEVIERVRPLILGGDSPFGAMPFGLLAVGILVSAIMIGRKHKSGNMSVLAEHAALVLVSIFLAAVTLHAPASVSAGVDSLTRQTATIAGSQFNASLTDGAHRNSVYRAWLQANFGNADSQIAKDYGPRLKEATQYTWVEYQQVQADPDAAEEINQGKAERYETIANEIRETDPAAYRHFQGREDRMSPSGFGMIAGFFMSLFAAISYIIILVARILMQGLVLVAPFAAVAGLLPRGREALVGLFGMFAAALWSVFKFSLAAGIMAVMLGLLSTMSAVAALIWMTAASIAALILLKPMKAFRSMTPGTDPAKSYTKKTMGLLKKIAALVVVAKTGGTMAGKAAASAAASSSSGSDDDSPATGPTEPGPVRPQLPGGGGREKVRLHVPKASGPPPVQWEQVPGTNRHRALYAPVTSPVAKPSPVASTKPLPVSDVRVTVSVGSGSHHSKLDQSKVVISGEVVDGSVFQPPVLKRVDGTVDRLKPKVEESKSREVEIYQSQRV